MCTQKSTLIAAFLFLFTNAFCQTLKYDVILLGKKIGDAIIEKKDSAGFSKYTLHSQSDAKILGMDKKDNMFTEAVFNKEGKLISSDFNNQKNKEHLSTTSVAKDNKIAITKDGKQLSLDGTANFSSLILYYAEPKDNQKIFSERLGKFVDIAKQKNGDYKIAFNDYTAVYTYKAGKITELQMKETAGEVVMKLVQ